MTQTKRHSFIFQILLLFLVGVGLGCSTPGRRPTQQAEQDDVSRKLVLLQINDVYETLPVAGGTRGGLARVATLIQELKRNHNGRVLSIIGGDFVSPSAEGTALVKGKPIAGEQMIATLNAMGLDLAVFGNHEFDLSPEDLIRRINERGFTWISGNVSDLKGDPYRGLPRVFLREFDDASGNGEKIKLGFVHVCIRTEKFKDGKFDPWVESVQKQIAELKAQGADQIVGVTHLSIGEDRQVAEKFPELILIIGGHEHENHFERFGTGSVPIAKADSNARTVYVHELDCRAKKCSVESQLIPITDKIPSEPETLKVATHYRELAYLSIAETGIDPKRVVAHAEVDLDGMESTVRNRSSSLTDLTGRSMLAAREEAEIALFIGGEIRIDDVIPKGSPITEFDLIRIFPFGDKLNLASLRGSQIVSYLAKTDLKKGSGGYTHFAGKNGLSREAIKPDQVYRVVMSDFIVKVMRGVFGELEITPMNTDFKIVMREFLSQAR